MGSKLLQQLGKDTFWDTLCKMCLIALLITYLVLAMLSPEHATGEVASFELPMISLTDRLSFQATESDYREAVSLFPAHVPALEGQYAIFPTDAEGNRYPWYFGVYAPLCALVFNLLVAVRLNPIHTFDITNALALALSLWVVYKFFNVGKKRKLLILLFLGLSPVIPYIQWESYEVVMFSFVAVAATFWLSGKRKLSAFFLSIAGTMNCTVMAFGIMMIADYFWEIYLLSEKSLKVFVFTCINRWKDILSYAVCFIPCLIPMAISYVCLGNLYPTISMGYRPGQSPMWTRFLAYIFDLNFGLFPYIPIVLALFAVIGIKGIKAGQHTLFFTFLGVIATIAAYSVQFHINSGATGIARYNSWLLPVIVLTTVFYIDRIFVSDTVRKVAKWLTVFSMAWCVFVVGLVYFSVYGGWYVAWNPLAETVLTYAPQLYNPLPSTFISRTTHVDGGYYTSEPVIYSSRDGYVRKALLSSEMLDEAIQRLWAPADSSRVLEREIQKISSPGKFYYLNFPVGTHIKEVNPYELNTLAAFDGTEQDAHRYIVDGISYTETDFAWTDGKEATLCARISEDINDDLMLQINLRGIFQAPQKLEVMCGDTVLFEQIVEDALEPIIIFIPEKFVQDRLLELSLRFPYAVSPEELGAGSDTRELAFAIASFSIGYSRDYRERIHYEIGTASFFDGSENDAHRYFVVGVSQTETDFTWTNGNEARLWLGIDENIDRDLVLQLDVNRVFNAPQRMKVMCGDIVLFDGTAKGKETVAIPIPTECVRDQLLELSFQFPDAISPKSLGDSEDTRNLAIGITSFSIQYTNENPDVS